MEKNDFYDEHGVEQYYIYDPARGTLRGYQRKNSAWVAIPNMLNWVSPRLQVRFQLDGKDLVLTGPDGRQFISFVETDRQRQQAKALLDHATARAELAERVAARADQERSRAIQERERAERLA